ncbi:putative sarcosine oxidase [Abeliophyllum distichum]|uniref:Sarcosine oxidase n=1 Tax=Abeliophyllum distichum TaxID=126358 RepID=A0ABD1TXL3_9LAMI
MFQTIALRNGAILRDNTEEVDIKKDKLRGGLLVCTKIGENSALWQTIYIPLEFPGLIKISVHGGYPCEPKERTQAALPLLVDSMRQWIGGSFGNLVDSNEPVMTKSCMYSMTPDEDFVIDFVGGKFRKDVIVGGGFQGIDSRWHQ